MSLDPGVSVPGWPLVCQKETHVFGIVHRHVGPTQMGSSAGVQFPLSIRPTLRSGPFSLYILLFSGGGRLRECELHIYRQVTSWNKHRASLSSPSPRLTATLSTSTPHFNPGIPPHSISPSHLRSVACKSPRNMTWPQHGSALHEHSAPRSGGGKTWTTLRRQPGR